MPSLLRTTPLAAAVVAIAAPASHSSNPAPTVAAYRSQANTICSREQRQTMTGLMAARRLDTYLTAEVPILRAALAAFKKLEPPTKLAPLQTQLVATVRGEVALFSSFAAKAKAGKLTVAQFEHDPQRVALTTRELSLWKRIGAKACAGP